jgi:hypothetical protein
VPGSLVHKAATYAGNLRVQLKTYLKDGRLEIDNNKAENSLRRVGLGRNNWLFFGSETGAEAAAVWMTLAACCLWLVPFRCAERRTASTVRVASWMKWKLSLTCKAQWIISLQMLVKQELRSLQVTLILEKFCRNRAQKHKHCLAWLLRTA